MIFRHWFGHDVPLSIRKVYKIVTGLTQDVDTHLSTRDTHPLHSVEVPLKNVYADWSLAILKPQ